MAQFRKDTHQYLGDGKTIFEVMMLADQYGNLIGPANPSGMSVDAFGRARHSTPLTLFDSFHRFGDNGKAATANSATATYAWNSNTATIDATVDNTNGAFVYRETKKVFAYQPGKSLQVLMTFVMNPAKAGLRQRVGYFGWENGIFLERNGASQVRFVKRSKVTGSVVDTPFEQADWNVDKLDGTGPSLKTLNLDNPQIMFIDIEWLGVGSIRMGFVIDGVFIHCHTINHANLSTSAKGAYMQTACLPLRFEIENTAGTASSSTYKQVCSTVISEGGYELRGAPRTYAIPVNTSNQFRLTTAGTMYPVLAFQLHPNRLDSITIPKAINILPINNGNYRYKLVYNPTITGAVWSNTSPDSTIVYNSNTTATISGGTDISTGYFAATTQSSGSTITLDEDLFRYQFERNGLANTAIPLALAITCDTATVNVVASMDYQEVTAG